MQSSEHSDDRRTLVNRIIQLRLQLQQLADAGDPSSVSESTLSVAGHRFVSQPLHATGRNVYCERCLGIVWRVVQPWLRCAECGYRAHVKCATGVTRVCPAQTQPFAYLMAICPERALCEQRYRCAECRAKLSFDGGWRRGGRLHS